MKKVYLLHILCIIFSLGLSAQEKIYIGEKHTMPSAVLNEEREYWVYLPPNYDNDSYGKSKYPVIYVLDGDKNFLSAVDIQRGFTKGMYNNMPECIVVGILNTDRTKDLTPSKSFMLHKGKKMFENSGGSDSFLQFINTELKPKIENQYRTCGYNILVGHSFGGLFTINTLLNQPESFNAYVAIDPSIWWDNAKMYKDAKELWTVNDYTGKTLFVAMANRENPDNPMHPVSIENFCTEILPMQPNKSNNDWKYYENENHGTIIIPAIFDSFKQIFEGIQLPVKEIPYNPELIEQYYQELSEKLQFEFIPDEVLIENIGKYALSVNNIDGAIKIFEYNCKNYPDSKNAKENLNKAMERKNKL